MVPRDRIRLDTGLIIRTEKSVLFVIPWGRHWIVGTTDTTYDADAETPVAELIAPILGWDAGDVARETEAYLRLVRTEYGGRLRADGDTAPVAHASA